MKKILCAALAVISLAPGWALDSNPKAVSDLLDRIGGTGTSARIETAVDDALLAQDFETFIITSKDGKPYVKGSTLSALTTGIGWYLNHYANVNLTWNQQTADLSGVDFPVPAAEERHETDAIYRYNFNYCTFSYSMSTWTWERWQQEIDWMALRGVNMPLQIVGLEEVWRIFLTGYGYSLDEVSQFVAGPCFMAWFGMNNLEGWGGPNPEWWYKRQAQLAGQILERERSLGMEPVLPGFYQVPSTFNAKTGVATGGIRKWQGFGRPCLIKPDDQRFDEVSANYYKALEEVMGKSQYYSMDPFHEDDSAPEGIDPAKTYQKLYEAMNKASEGSQHVIQYWQWKTPQNQSKANVPVGKLIILDLYSDGKPNYTNFGQHEVVFNAIPNFGGRTGIFGRFNSLIEEYWKSKNTKTVRGVGNCAEAIEQVPVIYDLLFELPWMAEKPDAKQWMADYTKRRYGQQNDAAEEAWDIVRNTMINDTRSKQGPAEAVLCGRPALDIAKVSSWGFADRCYDNDKSATVAYKLLDSELSGANYSFDLTDFCRQALTDYGQTLLAGIKQANADGNIELFNKRRDAFLQLILDLDELLGTNQNFMLGHWTERARRMADEVAGTTDADRDWLEKTNARTIITTWGPSGPAASLRDYSYREWNGMMKDFYYARWKKWFDDGMKSPNWFNWEWDWAHNNTTRYSETPVGDTHEVASRLLPRYISKFTSKDPAVAPYYVERLLSTDLRGKLFDVAYRDAAYAPDFDIKGTKVKEIAIDFNQNTSFGDGEVSQGETFAIPADSPIGERQVKVTLEDGTELRYTLKIIEEITQARTVTVKTADASQGTAAIGNGTSVTNTDPVEMLATPDLAYDFQHWTDSKGNVVSTDNPYTYYGKEAAEFTAVFTLNKWGVPEYNGKAQDKTDMASYKQFLTSLKLEQGGETTELYYATELPDRHYVAVPQRIKAAPGSEFTFKYTGEVNGLKYLFLSAYCDFNHDGTFDIDTELLGTIGTYKKQDTSVGNGTFKILLPYEAKEGVTHIRLRFDGAWGAAYDATHNAFPATAATNRIVYEIILDVTDAAPHVCEVPVASNNEEYGTVRSENMTDIYSPGEEVVLTAFPNSGFRFVKWIDNHGRDLPAEWCNNESRTANFLAFDNATITGVFEPIPLEANGWKFNWDTMPGSKVRVTSVDTEGEPTLDLSNTEHTIGAINSGIFAGTSVADLTLPATELEGDEPSVIVGKTINGTGNQVVTQWGQTIKGNEPFRMRITSKNTGATYNDWGTPLYANGIDATANDYKNGWSQVYLKKDGTLVIKWDSATEHKFTTLTLTGKFTVLLDYNGNKTLTATVTDHTGKQETKTITNSSVMKDMTQFANCLPSGMSMVIEFLGEMQDAIPGDIIKGAKKLVALHGTTYKETDGVLYHANGKIAALPEGLLHGQPIPMSIGVSPLHNGSEFVNCNIVDAVPNSLASLWTLAEGTNGSALRHLNSGLHLKADGSEVHADPAECAYSIEYVKNANPKLTIGGREIGVDTPVKSVFVTKGISCLPVAVCANDKCQYLQWVNGGVAMSSAEGVIAACTPFYLEEDATLTVSNVAATADAGSFLTGTLVERTITEPVYVLQGDKFVRSASGTLSANSGYVKASDIPAMTDEEFPLYSESVGLAVIDTAAEAPCYNVKGQRVSPKSPGLKIAKGQKQY